MKPAGKQLSLCMLTVERLWGGKGFWGGVAGHELGEVETASGREDGVLETSFEPLK